MEESSCGLAQPLPQIVPDAGYFIWTRGALAKLTANFTTPEFECACGQCVLQKISAVLLAKLERLRENCGFPLKITSGYRCSDYQSALRKRGFETAKGISTHELGDAADVHAPDNKLTKLTLEADKLFLSLGVASAFIHVDLRSDTKRRWAYRR